LIHHATVEVQTGDTVVRSWGNAIEADDLQTVAELGEFGLIAELSRWLPPDPRALVGIGDDAAVLAVPDGRVVATTDFLLEGRHFRRDWSSARDVGHKAAARSLADVAAMGGVPTALLVALAAPPDLPVSWARELAAGLAAECARVHPPASVVGGDTARADAVLLAVTALGDLAGRPPVRRGGAVPGDVVAVAGPLGHAAAGLALLSAGLAGTDVAPPPAGSPPRSAGSAPPPAGSAPRSVGLGASDPAWASLVTAQLRPAPPYDAGPEAAALGAHAMIDVSDGLLADLGHLADASGVQIDVDSAAALPAQAGSPLLEAARAVRSADRNFFGRTGRGITPEHADARRVALRWVLTGGEDHSLVATFPRGVALPSRWRVIGAVREGSGVLVDAAPWAGDTGWNHFA
jgi:thiamine-monophosphate kinase